MTVNFFGQFEATRTALVAGEVSGEPQPLDIFAFRKKMLSSRDSAMSRDRKKVIEVQGLEISVLSHDDVDYISLTDMLHAKDEDFFIADWLQNRNTVEFLSIWERLNNPDFNYGEFAIIKSQVGLNSYKLSVKDWVKQINAI